MSQKSTKIKIINNLSTSKERCVSERSTRVFNSARVTSVYDTVLLYKLVFKSQKAVLLAVLLLFCFISQPFQSVYADTDSSDIIPASSKVEIPPEFTQEVVEAEVISKLPTSSEDVIVENNSPPNLSEEDLKNNATSSSVVVVSDSISVNDNISTSSHTTSLILSATAVQNSTSTNEEFTADGDSDGLSLEVNLSDGMLDGDETASSTEINNIEQDDSVVNSDEEDGVYLETDSGDEVSEEDISDVDEVGTSENFVSHVESDSQFSFLKSECTRIEDGSFYCQKKNDVVNMSDSLVAAPDADGDLEIFLVRDGERTQITHNKVDDASPYYDEYSKTIVWHRLVNDRYQIISYDTNTGEEKQLTDTDVNNMEPTRHGDYTVWQRWVENNWEIILLHSSKEKQITNSSRHDIAPHVRGPLVIWNSRSNDGTQSLMTYDIQDRTYTTIADGEGVSVSNPRLMVMYEAMYENGDIVMKGFDVVTGKITPLQSLPQELPTDLPNTDSTGETRALIQSKPAPKQSEVVNNSATTSRGSSTPPILPDSESIQTLDLRATSTIDLDKIDVVFESPTSTIPDLVIPSPEILDDMSTSSHTI